MKEKTADKSECSDQHKSVVRVMWLFLALVICSFATTLALLKNQVVDRARLDSLNSAFVQMSIELAQSQQDIKSLQDFRNQFKTEMRKVYKPVLEYRISPATLWTKAVE